VSGFLDIAFDGMRKALSCRAPRVHDQTPGEVAYPLFIFIYLFLDCGAATRPKRPIGIESEQSGEKARVAQSKKYQNCVVWTLQNKPKKLSNKFDLRRRNPTF